MISILNHYATKQPYVVRCMQDAPSSSATKVNSMLVRHSHSHPAADNYDKIKQWIREQGQQCITVFGHTSVWQTVE